MPKRMLKLFLKSALASLACISLASTAQNFPYVVEEPTIKRQQQLHQLLLQDCSVCHGKLLKGGDLGPPLTFESFANKSEWALARTIIRGHDKTEMPAWAWEMEDYEARWMVRFIRSGRVNGKQNQGGSLDE